MGLPWFADVHGVIKRCLGKYPNRNTGDEILGSEFVMVYLGILLQDVFFEMRGATWRGVSSNPYLVLLKNPKY